MSDMDRGAVVVVAWAVVWSGAGGCAITAGPGGATWYGSASPGEREAIWTAPAWPGPTERRLATGAAGPAYWQQRVDYRIDATLDAAGRRLIGRMEVRYVNNSPHALDALWLNLDQNLFRRDSRGALVFGPGRRFGNRDGFDGGYDELRAWAGDRQLPIVVMDTIGRIDLDEPIEPGATFTFGMAWSFAIPPYGSDRLGIEEVEQGTVFQLAQWFPNVCVYDDVHGWNTLPYLGAGEFYTNFGEYEVRLTVPANHIVAATGMLTNAEEVLTAEQLERLARARTSTETVVIRGPDEIGGEASESATGTRTWQFRAENVRTFAFASSDAFIWDAASLTGEAGATLCQSFYPKEGLPIWSQSTQMLRAAILGYNRRWYVYPYPTASNVNGIVGGMEYPMIVFCRARRSEEALWGVTTHEIGHTWFPMVVNTDERRHAWLDEGLNTFINYYSWEDWFGSERRPRRGRADDITAFMLRPDQQPIVTPPDRVLPDRLGGLAYSKVAAGLVLLRERILGPERFDSAFRAYIERWAFRSPTPADFFRTIEDVSGEDLGWFWRGWFYGTGTLDQAVVKVEQDEDRVRVVFANRGELLMPLEYEVQYSDGTTERRRVPVEVWATGDRHEATWEARGRRVRAVVVDPDGAYPDVRRANNRW